MKKRIIFFSVFFALFAVELVIALFVNDSFIRPYFGDVLVIPLIYFFIRAIFPKGIKALSLYVFLFAVTVEVLQYFDFVALLGFENNRFISTILGRSFSFIDIVCYFFGALPCGVFELFEKKKLMSKANSDSGRNDK